eukprot:1292453-Pyramimonas_sp.AAC.1
MMRVRGYRRGGSRVRTRRGRLSRMRLPSALPDLLQHCLMRAGLHFANGRSRGEDERANIGGASWGHPKVVAKRPQFPETPCSPPPHCPRQRREGGARVDERRGGDEGARVGGGGGWMRRRRRGRIRKMMRNGSDEDGDAALDEEEEGEEAEDKEEEEEEERGGI